MEKIMKAIWNGNIIAESEDTVQIEGNHYFPIDSVKKEYLIKSKTETVCPWKGTANYYSININDDINKDSAWYYPEPKDAAKPIKNMIAFWKGVEVIN